jgi:hypothetical protein
MHHKHLGNIDLDPRSLELVLLPLMQQVIDSVPQLIMISAVVGGDCLLSGPEGWTLMTAEHIRSTDDFQDCIVLFLCRVRNSLDSKLWWSGDADAVQQIPQSASGDRGFISKSLDLIGVVELLFLLGAAQRSIVFIIFAFSLVALFFFLVVFFLLMVIDVIVVLRQLLSFLRVFSCWYRDHNLEGVLP